MGQGNFNLRCACDDHPELLLTTDVAERIRVRHNSTRLIYYPSCEAARFLCSSTIDVQIVCRTTCMGGTLGLCGGDTRAPTPAPTRAPTRAPTPAPTRVPTRAPTTRAPTASPTPSASPTSSPTETESTCHFNTSNAGLSCSCDRAHCASCAFTR